MAGSEDLVLKISADTAGVASGLAPMTNALDKLNADANETGNQLSKLDSISVSPTVDDAGIKSAGGALTDVSNAMGELDKSKATPAVDASNVDKLTSAAEESETALGKLERPVTMSVRDQAIQRARDRIEELKDQIAQDVEMGVDTKPALRELSTLERSIGELTDEPATIEVEVDPEEADFAFESMAKLKRGVRGLTDALLDVGDGVKAIPDLASAAVGSMTTLNASMSGFLERQAAAGGTVGRFASGLGRVTGFLAGPWGIAIAGGMTLLGAMVGQMDDADAATMDFAKSLDYQTGALERNNRVKAANLLRDKDLFGTMKELGISATEMTRAIAGDPISLQRLLNQLNEIDATQDSIIRKNQLAGQNIDVPGLEAAAGAETVKTRVALLRDLLGDVYNAQGDVIAQTKEFNEAVDGIAPATSTAANAVATLAGNVADTGVALSLHDALWINYTGRIGEARSELDKLVESLDLFNGRTASAREATAQYEEDIDSLTAALKENGRTTKDHGKTLDLSSAKGRANQAVIIKTARDIESLTEARLKDMETSGETSKEIMDDYTKQRAALIKSAEALGLGHTAAVKYVNQLLKTPDNVDTAVNLKGEEKAEADLEHLTRDRRTSVTVDLAVAKFDRLPKRIQDAISGNGSVNLSVAPAPPAPAPSGASPSTVFLQPRLFLDSRPIRAALRGDVSALVSSTVAATRTRGRM